MSQWLIIGWVPGTFELLVVAGVALLLFGHRLPGVMRNLGRGVVEFKKGVQDEGTDDDEPALNDEAEQKK
jgi:sec-independent protein translocase protein TatA